MKVNNIACLVSYWITYSLDSFDVGEGLKVREERREKSGKMEIFNESPSSECSVRKAYQWPSFLGNSAWRSQAVSVSGVYFFEDKHIFTVFWAICHTANGTCNI